MRKSITYREVPLIFFFSILLGMLCAGTAIWCYQLLGFPRAFWGAEAVVCFLLALLVPAHLNQKLFAAMCVLFYIALAVGAVTLLATAGLLEAILEGAFFFQMSKNLTHALNSDEI